MESMNKAGLSSVKKKKKMKTFDASAIEIQSWGNHNE